MLRRRCSCSAWRGEDKISFDLGPLNLQPAEMAKFTTLLMLASYLAEERSDEVSTPGSSVD